MSDLIERLEQIRELILDGTILGVGSADTIGEAAARIRVLEDALRSIREHVATQPSALAKAIEATCDNALGDAS